MPNLWRSSLTRMLRVPIGTSGQALVFSRAVLTQFEKLRQIQSGLPEAGGQLFAKLIRNQIRIEQATGPRPSDKRARMHYVPDRRAEQSEIVRKHKDGLHYVGDWHTHPGAAAYMSRPDRSTLARIARFEKAGQPRPIMIILAGAQEWSPKAWVKNRRSGWFGNSSPEVTIEWFE